MELLWEIAGWTGAALILGAYWAVSMGWLNAGRRFQAANLVGACAFILNGTFHEAWPSVATNIAWFLISAVALLRTGSRRKPDRPTPALVRQAQLPGLPDTPIRPTDTEVPAASGDPTSATPSHAEGHNERLPEV